LVSALRTAGIVTRYGDDAFLHGGRRKHSLGHLNTELGSTSDPCSVTIGIAQLRSGETSSDLVARQTPTSTTTVADERPILSPVLLGRLRVGQ